MRPIARTAISMVLASLFVALSTPAQAAWEPTKPIEFVIPASTGSGADRMARLIADIVEKYKMSSRPVLVMNRPGGAGAEGFLYVKSKRGDAHTILLATSNLFTTPLSTNIPFNWRDLTPVALLAFDQFVLWVNSDNPFQPARDYVAAVKSRPGQFKMGGTGTAQQDQIVTIQLEQALGLKFIFVPFRSGDFRGHSSLAHFSTS